MKNTTTLAPVISLQDLYAKACVSSTYLELAISAARNLGGGFVTNLDGAMKVLRMNALETDEEGVVDEVNFCR